MIRFASIQSVAGILQDLCRQCTTGSSYLPPPPPPVPPARIESLPRNGTALIRSNFSLPCGIVRGRLSNSFTLQWDLMRGEESFQHILTYNSDLDNQTLQEGVFTFDPTTEVLHVQNFTQFNSMLDFQCRVTVNRRDGAFRPATRNILVTIVYGESYLLP